MHAGGSPHARERVGQSFDLLLTADAGYEPSRKGAGNNGKPSQSNGYYGALNFRTNVSSFITFRFVTSDMLRQPVELPEFRFTFVDLQIVGKVR